MLNNLPPGVTDAMLPGNTQEDIAWDEFWEWAEESLSKLDISEAYMAIKIGISAVKAIHDDISYLIKEARQDERMCREMEAE